MAVEKSKVSENDDYNLLIDRYRITVKHSSKWEYAKLGDVCITSSGGTPLRSHPEFYENGTIPWLKSGEVAQGYIYNAEEFITEQALAMSSAKLFPVDTVLLAMYGATAGQVGILKIPSSTNQAVCGILPGENFIPEFLYLILKSKKDYLISQSSGGAQPNISQAIIKDLVIPQPPISFQKEIVTKVEQYEKIIAGAKQVSDSYKPEIDVNPEWEIVELGNVCETEYGFTDTAKENGEARFIRITDIDENGKLKNSDKKFIDLTVDSQKYLLRINDVVVARTGATFGKTLLFEEEYKAVFASYLIRLKFDSGKVNPKYYWCFSQSENYWKQANTLVSGGGQPQFNANAIVKLLIPLPSLSEQASIITRIEKEQQLVNASKELIQLFEQKIKDEINKLWAE